MKIGTADTIGIPFRLRSTGEQNLEDGKVQENIQALHLKVCGYVELGSNLAKQGLLLSLADM